jgi:glycosyltransferase involved in cell wall biosynthesis
MNARSSNIDFFGEKNIQEKLIIQVSRFIYPKDQKTLIKALKLLPAYIKLLLVGDGDQRKDCEDLVVQLGLEKRVAFLGVRLDVPELLKAADVVVLSSDFEGLSLSSIEGMASGRPFLASDVPGLTEIVKGAGILFPRGNFEKLAEEILNLLSDADYYDEISENCMARAKHYNLNNMVDQYIELYKKLINE